MLFTNQLELFFAAKISRWGCLCWWSEGVRLGELCGAGVRRMLLKSLQATYHALLPAFTTGFIGLRSVGRWVGVRASERVKERRLQAAHHRRHQTLAGSLVVLQPARVAQAQPRTADERSTRPRPTAELKRNFQMKGRDFICPLIKCRWLCQPRKLKWPSHLSAAICSVDIPRTLSLVARNLFCCPRPFVRGPSLAADKLR